MSRITQLNNLPGDMDNYDQPQRARANLEQEIENPRNENLVDNDNTDNVRGHHSAWQVIINSLD